MSFGMLIGTPGVVATLGMLVAVVTVAMGLWCAVKPDERRLALMRPLSLATIFAGICSFAAGLANMLQGIADTGAPVNWRAVSMGGAETLVPIVTAFGCLTVAWLLVALGLRRT